MKKWIAMLLAMLLLLSVFAGCSKAPAQDGSAEQDNASDQQTPDAETPDESGSDAEKPDVENPMDQPVVTGPEEDYTPVSVNVAVMKGPTGMGMAKLMDDSANGTAANDYQFTVSSDASEVMSKLIAGEYDLAALPTNSAAVAYNKTKGGVQMAAICTYGTLYLLQNTEKNETLAASAEDLKGKTIVTFGQGANPEYVLTHILEANGLTVGTDVTIDFKATVDEVLALAATGEAEYVMVPEPNATVVQTKNAAFQTALDLGAEWEKLEGTLVMGCVVTTAAFAEAHPEAVAKFLEEYEASIQYALDETDAAATLCATYEIVPNEAIAKKSLPNCHLTFISGADMQPAVEEYYSVLFGYNPAAVGGAIPDEGFYFVG